MRNKALLTMLAGLAPWATVAAVDRVPMEVPESNPPPTERPTRSGKLIDQVVPAYGVYHMRPYRTESGAEDLYHEVATFSGRVDAKVMAGELARPPAVYEQPTDEDGEPMPDAKPVLKEREPLAEEMEIARLLQRLAELREEIPFPNHYEQWHLDNTQRNLVRTAELLRLGLGDDRYLQLEQMHAAWRRHYLDLLKQARHQRAQELITLEEMRPTEALLQAEREIPDVPFPPMSLDGVYEPVDIPEILTPRERERRRRAAEEEARKAEEEARRAEEETARQAEEAARQAEEEEAARQAEEEAEAEAEAEVDLQEEMEEAPPPAVDEELEEQVPPAIEPDEEPLIEEPVVEEPPEVPPPAEDEVEEAEPEVEQPPVGDVEELPPAEEEAPPAAEEEAPPAAEEEPPVEEEPPPAEEEEDDVDWGEL